MLSAQEALARLREGNRRFVSGDRSGETSGVAAARAKLVEGQEPVAVVLGCSDSRVPPEIVFDQGLGDLFVIRVAGNTVDPPQIGSVEYAVEVLGTRLVVVLGHTRCGAIRATLDELEQPGRGQSPNLSSIIDSIRPSVESLLASVDRPDVDAVLRQAMRENVRVSARRVRRESRVIERLVEGDGLLVVGAEYSLETGLVDFFEGAPDAG